MSLAHVAKVLSLRQYGAFLALWLFNERILILRTYIDGEADIEVEPRVAFLLPTAVLPERDILELERSTVMSLLLLSENWEPDHCGQV